MDVVCETLDLAVLPACLHCQWETTHSPACVQLLAEQLDAGV